MKQSNVLIITVVILVIIAIVAVVLLGATRKTDDEAPTANNNGTGSVATGSILDSLLNSNLDTRVAHKPGEGSNSFIFRRMGEGWNLITV